MVVVSDTTAITNLIHVGKLYLLRELFGDIIIPEAVYTELSALPDHKQLIDAADWVQVRSAKNENVLTALLKKLDLGEAEAITLALEIKADVLIIDERLGRAIAKEKRLRIIGLIGILIDAKNNMLIKQLKPVLDELIHDHGFRVSPKLYLQILNLTSES